MAMQAEQTPVTPGKDEQSALDALDALLSGPARDARTKLIDLDGTEVVLPESVVDLLRQAVHQLARQRALALIPIDRDLTTQQVANILHVSRPYLISLLEHGEIPYTKVGAHRRISLDDVMRYKAQRDISRKQTLDELARLNQEMGLYDK